MFSGGLQEVVFTHSNQRVVGGSKAEERISRAALRHVFVRKVHSQLPANQVLDSQGEVRPWPVFWVLKFTPLPSA